jgi:hypothetical protein
LVGTGERIERGGSSFAVRCVDGVIRQWHRWNLDCRQPNFASVIEYEGSPIHNAADRAAGDLIAAASVSRLLFRRARRSVAAARRRKTDRKHGSQDLVQDRIPPNRFAVKRKAGMRRYCGRALTLTRHKPCRSAGLRPMGNATPIRPRSRSGL